MKTQYMTLNPRLRASEQIAFLAFSAGIFRELRKIGSGEPEQLVQRFRQQLNGTATTSMRSEDLEAAFAKSVVLDLVRVGWRIRVERGKVRIASPRDDVDDPEELKSVVRRSHLFERDDQLREASVREFIQGMERRQLTRQGWHSIFSLMRDGGQLAATLREIATRVDCGAQLKRLAGVIDPYIQLVTENGVCEHTALHLRDIWRYFRHTWVNSYKSLPGRSMSLLIRDAAAPYHPVIGIAALGSSVAQQRLRDVWIGWDQETIVETIRKEPSTTYAQWLLKSLEEQILGLYLDDLFFDGTCTREEILNPSDKIIAKLERNGDAAIKEHRLFPHAATHKASQKRNGEPDWELQAQTSLFRSKRCKMLAKLLRIRATFQRCRFAHGTGDELKVALERSEMRNVVGQLVRAVKSHHVGIDMMDIIICGAVAPYNALLGGKLVCMLLCSPEIVGMYQRRYGAQESIIASSMRGKPVVRVPQLVLLGTTSLYGIGSSQYNRVRIPCQRIGGSDGEHIVYEKLGKSEGYGSYHFGELTVSLGDTILARQNDGRRVNSIFGEGVNPRMRKLREAFEIVGLPSDEILQHRNPRIVYGVPLARNFKDVLLGLASIPEYVIPQSMAEERTRLIADYWRERWLLRRIRRLEVLEQVAKHNLAYPVTHGARVVLPLHEEPQAHLKDFE
jgi:hypothetical protein